jgi:aldose 1-epimerase
MIEQYAFGEVDGEAASAFELSNGSGLRAKVTSFGATLTELHVPDR